MKVYVINSDTCTIMFIFTYYKKQESIQPRIPCVCMHIVVVSWTFLNPTRLTTELHQLASDTLVQGQARKQNCSVGDGGALECRIS